MRGVVRTLTGIAAAAWLTLAPARPAIGSPAEDPLWKAEIQAAYGLAVGGSGEAMSRRPTPLTITALAATAFNADPPLAVYGGLTLETLDRNAVGMVAGVELHPHRSWLHVDGGATLLMLPYTLYGATVALGACGHATRAVGLCADLVVTAFLAGSDLPDGRSVTQAQFALGLVFDAP